ncbi:MAG TPA: HAMP domain-containing sensor histidine kinase, partial [Longimicrobiaceae bacterium]|nr:HAMP domain-containing sensor histidine kinase [Longimicrobiaceae bacterium]
QAATLREQAQALAQAMDERSRFFASMSHELRTPINAILGYTNLLRDGIYGEVRPEQAGALERVVVSGAHLLDIVNDVLDISKIDAGRLEISPAVTDLGMLLREAVSSVQVQAEAKGLEVVVEVPAGLDLVTDAGRVTQILLNLLSNAVKFTDAGCISARLACVDGWAEVRVGDTGPGIPAEDHERVFSEFEQTETAVGRGGTGLGLAISRRLAVLLGGTLGVESGPGPGSTFVLRLPAPGVGAVGVVTGEDAGVEEPAG